MNSSRIIAEARKWLGTPYHHQSDILGLGVDCAMLPVRVFCDLGLVPPFDPRPYPHDWMLHRDDERYLGWVQQYADPIEAPEPGALVLYRFGRCFSHGGICENDTVMIHADLQAGCVERCDLSRWAKRKHSFWRVRG